MKLPPHAVHLDGELFDRAFRHAIDVQARVIRERRSTVYEIDGLTAADQFHWTLQGAYAEAGIAKLLGYEWTGPTGRGAFDVGGWIEVRSVDNRSRGLKVKQKDLHRPDHTPFVLALCGYNTRRAIVQARGWMTVRDVWNIGEHYHQKGIEYARVPSSDLRPMEELYELRN